MLRRLYDWTMSLAARKSAEVWLAVIAFVESSVFLVPADVLYLPMALSRPDRAYRYALVATAADCRGEGAPERVRDLADETIEEALRQRVEVALVDEPVAELRGPTAAIGKLAFSSDGRTLASAADTVRLWDVARRAQRGPALHITAAGLAFSKDSRMVTVVNRVGRISRHDVHRPGRFVEAPYDTSYEEYVDAEVAPSGTFVALAGESGPAVWALRGRTPRPLPLEGEGSTASPWVVAMSRNRVVAAGPEGAEKTIMRSPWARLPI